MVPPKSRAGNFNSSIFSEMSQLAEQHKAIDLSQGFPDFKTDPVLHELVSAAIKNGHNQYAPMPGLLKLREAIAEKFYSLYNKEYSPESEITVTAGATQALYTAITSFVLPGDEVVVFKPAYDSYEPAIEFNGGIPVLIQMKGDNYEIDWEEVAAKIGNKTKMIIINTPHNPSGVVFSKDDMLQLQKIVENTNIIILSDEVYEHLVFDGIQHQSVALFQILAERSLICASFGKTFHNTGWKMGYCVGPNKLMEPFRMVHQYQVFCVNHPIQIALAEYLKNPHHYLQLNGFYQQKRDFFNSRIKGSRFTFSPSEGTYFQVLDYSAISYEPDVDFAKRLIKEKGLASIPISRFSKNFMDNRKLRFCFAKTEETLEKAAQIICSI